MLDSILTLVTPQQAVALLIVAIAVSGVINTAFRRTDLRLTKICLILMQKDILTFDDIKEAGLFDDHNEGIKLLESFKR